MARQQWCWHDGGRCILSFPTQTFKAAGEYLVVCPDRAYVDMSLHNTSTSPCVCVITEDTGMMWRAPVQQAPKSFHQEKREGGSGASLCCGGRPGLMFTMQPAGQMAAGAVNLPAQSSERRTDTRKSPPWANGPSIYRSGAGMWACCPRLPQQYLQVQVRVGGGAARQEGQPGVGSIRQKKTSPVPLRCIQPGINVAMRAK